jgi:hypothetical protein
VRTLLYGTAATLVAMLVPAETLRSALATASSTLFEATPFLLAGMVLARVVRAPTAMAYLGCGCGGGPSARSLPAAAATWMVFGPAVALARFGAAAATSLLLLRRIRHADCDRHEGGQTHEPPAVLGELASLLPAALLSGAAMQLFASFDARHASAVLQTVAGGLFGFVCAPCALGSIALAGALHARAPLSATSFLCVSGVVDLRAFARHRACGSARHDALAYAVLTAACAIVAVRRGDALVHPVIAVALAACAVLALGLAVAHRKRQSPGARVAPVLMLAGALIAAPPPVYRATETTLADLFPGERLSFTGVLVHDGAHDALVRYAITCCRADASPVAIRLDRTPPYGAGTWLRADGIVAAGDGGMRLNARKIVRVAPPSDPFVYR